MTEKHLCYQCVHLKSKHLITGRDMTFGYGCCRQNDSPEYRFPKYLQEPPKDCRQFTPRTPEEISAIEKWMDKHGITAYIRSMA